MRTKYSLINIVAGVGGHLLNMVLSFVSRMVFIRYLAAAYLGVNGLFSDILGMLNLAELGIGSAMIFSMYKPAAEDNREELGRLMNLYRMLYRIVAAFVLVVGLALLPFLDVLIKGDSGIENLRIIYLMYLGNSVCSYLLSYKNSILLAYQKAYVKTVIEQLLRTMQMILQIVVLALTGNFLLYLALQIGTLMMTNAVVAFKVDRDYPYLRDEKRLPDKEKRKDILKNIMAMGMHRFGSVIVSGTDNLIMSAFVGLTSVGIYSNYRLVLKSLNDLLCKVYSAFTGSVGNLGATEDGEYVYKIYKQLDFFMFLFYGYITAGLATLFNPFMRLMFGESYLFPMRIVLVLIVQFYVSGMRQINLQFREAMGLFWHDRYKAVAEAIINLVTSLILVQHHGVTGVFLGTIISTMTTCFWVEPYVLMKYGIKTDWQSKLKTYFADYGRRTATVLVGGLLGYGLFARHIDTVMMFILKGVGFTMVYGALVLAVFGRTAEFRALFEQGKRIIGRKMSKGK